MAPRKPTDKSFLVLFFKKELLPLPYFAGRRVASALNLSLQLRPGGCLCEILPLGGGVEHLRVV
jgi:hypothetical protein